MIKEGNEESLQNNVTPHSAKITQDFRKKFK